MKTTTLVNNIAMTKPNIDNILNDIFECAGLGAADLDARDQADFDLLNRPKSDFERQVEASARNTETQLRRAGLTSIPGFGSAKTRTRDEFNRAGRVRDDVVKLVDALEDSKKSNQEMRDMMRGAGVKIDIPDYDEAALTLAIQFSQFIAKTINDAKENAVTAGQVYDVIGRHIGFSHS